METVKEFYEASGLTKEEADQIEKGQRLICDVLLKRKNEGKRDVFQCYDFKKYCKHCPFNNIESLCEWLEWHERSCRKLKQLSKK